ncbi:MAG: transposase [Candidatus Thiodiazotropha sp.]
MSVPWAEPGSGLTSLFEALVIDWLKEASISAVSRLMNLSWNAIDGIMQRAVKRGRSRREEIAVSQIGVDETAFKKRHDYVMIVSDQQTGTVLHVGQDRKKETLKVWEQWLSWAVRSRLDPIKEVVKAIKAHLWGILNTVVLKVSNGPAEGLNSRIKMIKVRSRVLRNKERFACVIYFHLGGLDLYPEKAGN